ncbi:RnfABCDGE type electron transport complex subunit D [Falsihalocynthiibacter sp. S25ZX9]|uniref:RnfABCDGE type electron transport complex subunit D n=1 Tax=Falsihalocynthiibacter sp. S25ZX9 TaxID=3240870 RepID=UPI00350EA708
MRRQNAYLPPLWNSYRVTAATCFALLPPLALTISERGVAILLPLVVALALAGGWAFAFSRLRHKPIDWHGIVTALVFILLAPSTVPLWQQGLALTFGLVLGDLIFGERGRGFLNASVVALAFLLFSFPGITSGTDGPSAAIAAGISGALLLVFGLLSWRIVVGFCIGLLAITTLLGTSPDWTALQSATLILGLVFLIGDPVAAASTNVGRWLYGGFSGGLLVILGQAGGGTVSLNAVVFTALLASIFAPLIDQIVITANVRRRAKRQAHD